MNFHRNEKDKLKEKFKWELFETWGAPQGGGPQKTSVMGPASRVRSGGSTRR